MKSILTILFFVLIGPFTTHASYGHYSAQQSVHPSHSIFQKGSAQTIKEKRKIIETTLGRKLTMKERIALRLQTAMPEYHQDVQRKANSQAVTGFVLSLVGLVILWPLLIAGFIISNNALKTERQHPGILQNGNLGLAKAGKIIGIVGLALLVLAVMIIVAVLSTGVYL